MTSTRLFLAALFLVANSLLASSWAFSDPREPESLKVRIDFRGTATVAGTAESLSLSLYSVPDGANCTVPVETDSEGRDFVRFFWKNPGSSAGYSYSCTVETGRSRAGLLRDEPIPSAGFGNYTSPSELVLITPEIASKAHELIAGVDGEFLAASMLASWVHANMKYDKSYFGRVLDSRRVFEGMTGVCEEYSHLLLAMLRSVGIPSRYVTGLVYGQDSWAPHSWVEAFFPGQNVWIPFDPTYGEYGYVDASHVRFFDSTDGGFAASRTSFTYNALGPRPSTDWEEPTPGVTIESEKSGGPITEVGVLRDEQTVEMGQYALVKANVKNLAGTLLYTGVRLIYEAKTLEKSDNLELVFGNDTQFFELMPGEEKAVYWALKVKSRYSIIPKIVAENRAFDAGEISGLKEAAGNAEVIELFSDRDGYGREESAKVTAVLKGREGSVLTELTTGASKAVPSGGGVEFMVPAKAGQAAVYSSGRGFARMDLPLRGSGLNARLTAPERVVAGRPFEATVTSLNPALRLTGGGVESFSRTMNESGTLTVAVFSEGGEKFTLRKYIEVLPAPELVPSAISKSGPGYSFTIQVRNGLLSSAKTFRGQSSYESLSGDSGRLSFADKSAKCGKRLELQVEAATRDLLGQANLQTYMLSQEVKCGPLETLLQKILDFLFAKF